MINARNIIIKNLHTHIGKPIIPNTVTENRPAYPFCDYSITALIMDKGIEDQKYTDKIYAVGEEPEFEDLTNSITIQNKISFSINSYSTSETESYNLIKSAWNFFKHAGINILMNNNIAVVDVLNIQNRTILNVDDYEIRYGFDAIIRYKEVIDRTDLIVENYTITKKE